MGRLAAKLKTNPDVLGDSMAVSQDRLHASRIILFRSLQKLSSLTRFGAVGGLGPGWTQSVEETLLLMPGMPLLPPCRLYVQHRNAQLLIPVSER